MKIFHETVDKIRTRLFSVLKTEAAPTTQEKDITIAYTVNDGGVTAVDPFVRGEMFNTYDEILTDDQVWSVFQQRRLALVSTRWTIKPGAEDLESKRAAEELMSQLENIDFDRVIDAMLFGIFYGFSVGECLYKIEENQVKLTDIKVRKQRRFRFNVDGEILLKTTRNPQGEKMPDYKFWVFKTNNSSNTDSVYGSGLAHWLYWPVTLKKSAVKSWVTLLDKYGMPTTIGKFPPSATADDRKRLLKTLSMITSSSGVIIPEGVTLELLEPARQGNVGHFDFIHIMNDAISKIILSQTMTTDNGSSLSQAMVHMEVRAEVVKSDAELISSSFNNSVLKWLCHWNYPNAVPPKLIFLTDVEEDLTSVAKRLQVLCDATGYKPKLDYIKETFGGDWEDVKQVK